MKQIVTIIFLLVCQISFSQDLSIDIELVTPPDQHNPQFQGGDVSNFYAFVKKEFDFAKVTAPDYITVSFAIATNGTLQNIKLIGYKNINVALELINVLNKSPKWEPATKAGKPIEVNIKMPVKFNFRQVNSSNRTLLNKQEVSPFTTNNTANNQQHDNKNIELKPRFAGGVKSFYEFISQNYNIPSVNIKGKVEVEFVVDTLGALSNFKIIKDLGYGTGQEAIRVLKLCPRWQPGTQNGKKVRCIYKIPIVIKGTE